MTALRRFPTAIAIFILLTGSASGERVLRVKDGDSLRIDSAGNEVEVRIADIDAPELRQPYGEEARAFLANLVEARDVRLELVGGDVYRRIVARVIVEERDVAAELVGRGLAWVRRAYAPDSPLIGLEQDARSARRGLWADSSPVPPWIWRKTKDGSGPGDSQRTSPMASPDCDVKKHCREMSSCEEAIAYLHDCDLQALDGDGDGIPCERLCRYYR